MSTKRHEANDEYKKRHEANDEEKKDIRLKMRTKKTRGS